MNKTSIKNGNVTMQAYIPAHELANSLIAMIKDQCWCQFQENKGTYEELVKLIQKRKKEPMDYGCIE